MSNKYTRELLEGIVRDCYSFADMTRKLNLAPYGGSQAHLKSKVIKFNIDYSHFKGNAWSKNLPRHNIRKKPEEILIIRPVGSHRETTYRLRRALLESNVKEECSVCGIGAKWNGVNLTLEIDHINGNYLDNTKENLRFICPNCHSQTPTYKNKNTGRDEERLLHSVLKIENVERHLWDRRPPLPLNKCIDCEKKVSKKNGRCKSCAIKFYRPKKINWPSINDLKTMLNQKSYVQLGQELGVSDNAIRKHIKNYSSN